MGDVEGFGQTFVVSEEQKLDWADMFYLITLLDHMRKPHLFPQLPLPFSLTMRMNYYPPCPQPDLVIGINPHSDDVGLTILLQVKEMEGLQIRKYGTWNPVKALRNAFIVNIGDILKVLNYIAHDSRVVTSEKNYPTLLVFNYLEFCKL
ncbi:2-oxoglutarate (2OG) and Fe(II)-dependent oxygenase superfamily protein [Quillaja saponaria]|uniref:2-oxoglutarate (2OG) and Fe(II)-dependent oxygenase superfamily protein n=1 Tax=Quillaja saponaria TaxID=32244 RepID=A0AAD7VKD1_QUISA|nr:2-oxoglutarate (2OG) and Fe(II)-dependent oxygenase superfamily protein [Quillaja saponaria]